MHGVLPRCDREGEKSRYPMTALSSLRVSGTHTLATTSSPILPIFGDRLAGKATRELEKMGVEIHVNSIVTQIDADGIGVKGPDGSSQHFSAKTKVWAAGVLASPLARVLAQATGAACDHTGRIKVEPDCSLRGYPEVFVGDMMNYNNLPGVAEVAIQSGLHAARAIKERVKS